MFPQQFDYHRAASVAEAVDLLASLPDAKLVAGGHSLIPAMKLRAAQPAAVVDIGRIPGLSGIAADGDSLVIGALATHASLADSAAVQDACPMLAEAAAAIGDIQVRNRGTLGGSLAHADPGADYPAAMLALGAEVTAVGREGERTISASDFFVDILTTALSETEVITSVRVPGAAGGAYLKHRHPASSYAVVGVAARVALDGGQVTSCAIGINGVAGKAVLAEAAAEALGRRSGECRPHCGCRRVRRGSLRRTAGRPVCVRGIPDPSGRGVHETRAGRRGRARGELNA